MYVRCTTGGHPREEVNLYRGRPVRQDHTALLPYAFSRVTADVKQHVYAMSVDGGGGFTVAKVADVQSCFNGLRNMALRV